jgi:poly-gamma-glutamate synthesis protein (capsule biosynthesis protein)
VLSILIVIVVGIGLFAFAFPEEATAILGLKNQSENSQANQTGDLNEGLEIETSKEDDAEIISKQEEPVDDTTELIFTGDVLLSDYVLNNYNASGIDGVMDENLRTQLQEADILEVNNEFPYSTRGTQAPDKQYTFRVDPSYVSILQEMGVDAAGLANNHVLDYGKDALLDTFTTLDGAGIDYTGAGTSVEDASKLLTYEINGKTYGILAASRVIPVGSWNVENSQPGVFCTYDPTLLVEKIKAAKETCDYVFVCVHWGVEHTDELTDYQQSMAHQFVDAGADAVIGAHPHVLQGIEYYEGKPIFYSLGNFIFNQNIDSTVAVRFTISGDSMQTQLIPATASGAKTSLANDSKKESIYTYLESISSTVQIDENGKLDEK